MDKERREMSVNEQLLIDAKARLQWYVVEASEDEFDAEEVDLLVSLISKLEQQTEATSLQKEKELERFHTYVDLYKEDEVVRECKKQENVKRVEEKTTKKILHFSGKGLLIAVAACFVLVIVAGSSFGEVNAGEDTGFFHWLKKDKTGTLAITSPDKNSVGMEDIIKGVYGNIEELPEEYRQYMMECGDVELLQGFELQGYWCEKGITFNKVREEFKKSGGDIIINLGVLIYPDNVTVTRETFENYDYLHTNYVDERELDVFVKEEEMGKLEYMVLFYENNKKFFVSGNEKVDLLEAVCEEYMKWVLE